MGLEFREDKKYTPLVRTFLRIIKNKTIFRTPPPPFIWDTHSGKRRGGIKCLQGDQIVININTYA